MKKETVIMERTYPAPVEKVWKALTDKDQMKQWYFDLDAFKPEVGFEFSFTASSDHKQYVHLCRITEVITGKKLAYTWRYKDYPGDSVVTFELFDEGNSTRVTLTHEGLETFPKDSPDFAQNSFLQGWTHILGTSLKNFLEQ